ncbi:crotonyl-CoA carboxylase/reductase [Salsipaludibacter albus]|uniref:crotonyl-CoA carboxylase/reductase n=1 Tax=Salsipaludibacter albus TaxID=2849650 RepID=UPI001EE4280B|nr:crotonyl-CoA carboxylase/reductase [Salsipaludibacter albus]MBY5163736.1 crotonyl-CoA carboxylase/reductase [Salsipaludibacter albus]
MQEIHDAIAADADGDTLAGLELPDTMRAAVVRKSEVGMFDGLDTRDKDPRESLHVDEVPIPPLGPNEVLIAPMASAINFNTVWTSIFEPVSTFGFLERFAREGDLGARHDLPYHIVGSDAAGVVLRTGPGVTRWRPGDRVTVHCNYVDMEGPEGHDDSMLDSSQRIWGFETNFGALAEVSMVKANQLMPMPTHLTWEEAGSLGLVMATSYRMLVGQNEARMKQGDIVLVWGATGGLGGFATQFVLNGGGIPVCVVSSPEKVALLHDLGVEHVIDRRAEGYAFWTDDGEPDFDEYRRFGSRIRELVGADPDIVFEHPGRATFGASVFVARKGGTIVTCASTTGYEHRYDNRYLWMNLKNILGSHFANYNEAWEANRLVARGMIHPILSATHPLHEVGEAAHQVHHNLHTGKVGILVGAAEEGLGVRDHDLRAAHRDDIDHWKTLA